MTERLFRVLSTLTVLMLAAAAAILSFTGLRDLGLHAGFDPHIAWLLPIVLDGMVLTGSLGVISSDLIGVPTWYPWMLTVLGVIASIAGNVVISKPDLTSQLVHGAAPVTFALSIEGLLRIYRASAVASAKRAAETKLTQDAASTAVPETKPATTTTEPTVSAPTAPVSEQATTGRHTWPPVAEPAPAPVPPTPEVKPSPTPAPEEPALTKTPATADATAAPQRTQAGSLRTRLLTLLAENPEITAAQAARELGSDPSHTRKVMRDLRAAEPSPTQA